MRWLLWLLVALAAIGPVGAALAAESSPAVDPLALDVTLRPDGGVDGELLGTWHAGTEPIAAVWKTIGHGARITEVLDRETGRVLAYNSTVAPHEARIDVALDRPIPPGGARPILLRFDQTHVWHYDPTTRTLSLNVPWIMSWEIDVRDVALRVHVPPELGPMPEPNGWAVDGRTLVARRAEGAPRLTLQMPVAPEAIDSWTAPLAARVPLVVWVGLAAALVVGGGLGFRRWLGWGRPVPDAAVERRELAALGAASAAALLAPGNDRVLVEACLLTLVDRGAVELVGDPAEPGDVVAVEQPGATLGPDERRWLESLFSTAPVGENGSRRLWLSDAIGAGVHREWRRAVESDLGRAGLLEGDESPGLGGLSYAGWAARERLREELRAPRPAGGPGGFASAGLAAAALAIGVGVGAVATLPSRIELDSQQYAIGSIVFDGTPVVRLRYALARLLPVPASHGHDFQENCGNGCGFGFFVGDHSCASSCGGVA